VEARHVDVQQGRWVFPKSEEKMNRTTRVVYLTDQALEITQRLVLAHPEGPLFRNTHGVQWTTDAVNCRFSSIAKKLGKKYCLYAIRHTWMNRLLTSGVDGLTVAILAGHADPSMLARTYQHLSQNPEYLRGALRKATA
jgi:integrase